MTTPAPTDPLIGTTVSQYEIVAKLGGGGMGVVYKARDTKLGRSVALKFLPPQWSHDASAKQRFVREAQAASATNHRNICVIHNIEETPDGRLFIVMAYYEGETLKQKLERGPLPIVEATEIASEIADGLAKAHAQGVVHRDVKPGNLMVTEDGVKILDFGLAKFADALQLTVPGSTIGTIAYMSPEQARGEEADARSDVWALGIVMYEMLAGWVPFRGTYQEATFHAIKNEPLPSLRTARPDVPEALERIVNKALEKDPARRFQNAREPARELKLLAGRTVPLELQTIEVTRPAVSPDSLPKRSRRFVTRGRVFAAVALVMLVAAAWYLWTIRPVERLRVAVVPVANHTGSSELDQYRLALTSSLIDELSESPNLRVVPYLRLVEMVRTFSTSNGDVSSNEAVRAIAAASGAPFLIMPTLVYKEHEAGWAMQVQVRNAQTGTAVASYETPPVTSSLLSQTAFRLVATAAEQIQEYFKSNGPGRSYRPRPAAARFRDPDAARAFTEGISKFEELEYAAALEAFTRSARADDQHALTYAWLGRLNLLLNRKNEAVAAAQRARSLVGGDTPRSEAAFIEAVSAESTGDFEAAEKIYSGRMASAADEPWWSVEFADFLKRREATQRAITLYHAALQADPAFIRPHVDLCQLYTRIADHPLAEKEASLALAAYRSAGLTNGEAQALLCLGESQRVQSGAHLADARRNVEQARSLIASLDQPYNLSRAVFYQGNVEFSDGQLARAAKLFEEASTLTNKVGNRETEALALMNLAVINYLLGHPSNSIDLFQRSRNAFLAIGNERRVAEVDLDRTAIEVDYGSRSDEVMRRLANAKANLEKLGYVNFQLVAMQSEADSGRYAGRLAAARTELLQALAIAREKQLTSRVSVLTLSLAETEIQASNYRAARELLEGLLKQGDDPEARIALGTVLMRMGDFANARMQFDAALKAVEIGQFSRLLPLVHGALGELDYENGRDRDAEKHFSAAMTAWTDPLPNAASIGAQCYHELLSAASGARFDAAIRAARQTGRLALEAQCAITAAQSDIQGRRFASAMARLKDIPDDTSDTTIGPELRARAEYWLSAAMTGAGQDGEPLRQSARERVNQLQQALPTDVRDSFAGRRGISIILGLQSVRTHP